ncbi:MAG: ABC transporter ATP-binding protein, partial [Pseudomonadales bacterium]|nr:ABC transporter ATP-binding protein [Pseudomonadales bacterium]
MTAILSIQSLNKTYKNGFVALDNICLDVERGDIFGLLGPNGAGKSTLIGIISSLVNKTSGTVKINSVDIDMNFSRAKKQIGIVPQEFNFSPFEKVYDILVTQAGYYGLKPGIASQRAETYLKELGLWEKRFEKSRELSGGMKRRLMIARALIHEPELLILDEPTAGVDIELRRSMWEFVKKINRNGTTIILTTHYLEEAENLCNNIAIINKGRIITQKSKRELLSQINSEVVILDVQDALL